MKKLDSKADIRCEIEQQISDYLTQGGEVMQVDRGISGRDRADGPLPVASAPFGQPKTERTYVPEVVAALESRRGKKTSPTASKPTRKRARKKMIYDDFGEPLRWAWVEE